MFKFILIFLLAAVIAVGGYFWFDEFDLFNTNKSSEISLVQDKLVELSEWTTLEYQYRNVIVSRTERSVTLPIVDEFNFAETIKLIDYTGYLKAGTDMSKVEISYDEAKDEYLVRVPKSTILDNVAETENMTVEDIKGSILSDYPTQTFIDEINAAKEQLEKDKIAEGFLDEADLRVESLLSSFLESFGLKNIVIEFY